jgi:hypothetical protein
MTITLTREEAQKILAVLEYPGPSWPESRTELAVVLRYKLSAPEPEPVAWMYEFGTDNADAVNEVRWYKNVHLTKPTGMVRNVVPLYAAPPQREWQGLTDEEIRNEAKNHVFDESFFSGAIWARGQIMGKNNE